MKFKKIMLWSLGIVIVVLGCIVYAFFNGTPWEKYTQQSKMKTYLADKYQTPFIFEKTRYNFLSETYQATVYLEGRRDIEFMVQEDREATAHYSDTFPEAFWNSDLANPLKSKFIALYPNADQSTLQAQVIVSRGEFYGPHIPLYKEVPTSLLACSITIQNRTTSWDKVYPDVEMNKMKELGQYLQTIHLPVLIEIWYSDIRTNADARAFFISEDGRIIQK